MLHNYLKIALRNLFKHKIHSGINIFGLATGVAAFLLILMYVYNEWQYDCFHTKSDQLYRVVQSVTSDTKEENQASTPFPLAPVLNTEFAGQIKHSVRFYDMQEPTHTLLNKERDLSFTEDNLYFVDSSFFDVFTATLIRGNADEVLKNPFSMVITEELARKYFGEDNPIGQTLSYRGIRDMTITGVMEAWPRQSHMNPEVLISFSSLDGIYSGSPDYDQSWHWNPLWTYVLLERQADPENIEQQFSSLINNYYYAYSGWPSDETVELQLQPVTDIHLHSNRDQEMQPNSSATYVNILLSVGIFILLIACINFMNLATARSAERSREVGIRKVLGGYRNQLFYQFLGESLLISFFAVIAGVALAAILLPAFNELANRSLSLQTLNSAYLLPGLFALALLTGVIAGSYPALFMSSFKPVKVLKGNTVNGKRSALFRKILVTFQFSLSVFLIIATLVIFKQLNFIQNKDLGFDKNQVLLLPTKQNLIAWEFETFKEQALSHSQIQSVAGIGKIPGNDVQEYFRFVPGETGESTDGTNQAMFVTHGFTETFDIDVLAGRSFSREFATDPGNAVLINQKMAEYLGYATPEEALGHPIHFYTSQDERESYRVIGVVNDFNYTSLRKEISPVVMGLVEETRRILGTIEYTAVEIAPGDASEAIAHLESIWEKINYVDPFEYRFLDEELQEIYKSETTMSSLTTSFAILCIIIACLGLLGLASYSAQLRRKEIGIRKSMGASIINIVGLLSKEFLVLVGLANIIAWPLAWYFSHQWLQNFSFRFDVATQLPLIFLGSGILILLIAMATVSYHALKAATLNPVEAIRNE